jgi:hypothetical protein
LRTLISAVQRLDGSQQRLVIRQIESLVQAFHEENVCDGPVAVLAENS